MEFFFLSAQIIRWRKKSFSRSWWAKKKFAQRRATKRIKLEPINLPGCWLPGKTTTNNWNGVSWFCSTKLVGVVTMSSSVAFLAAASLRPTSSKRAFISSQLISFCAFWPHFYYHYYYLLALSYLRVVVVVVVVTFQLTGSQFWPQSQWPLERLSEPTTGKSQVRANGYLAGKRREQ